MASGFLFLLSSFVWTTQPWLPVWGISYTKKEGEYIPYRNEPGDVPALANFGVGYRYHITGLFHDEQGFSTQRMDEIDREVEGDDEESSDAPDWQKE